MSKRERPVVLVTGAGRGIGAVIARTLGKRGYDIALHYWDNEEGARALSQEIQEHGGRAALITGDLTLDGVPAFIVDEAVRDLGQVDALVNNAGVTISESFLQFDQKAVEYAYRINFLAPYLCAQRCAAQMVETGIAGTIVNVTSVHQERVTDCDSAYGSMKAALARATESMAYELAPHRIRVNAVEPGRIRTSRSPLTPFDESVAHAIPLGRSGTPEDIAEAVAWLLSPAASYVTGVAIRVDGGMNLPMQRALMNEKLSFF
ncbi:SDR family NAD(P)-dependent oxidoreductase [Alicyclobacillus fastidiosus]|uniref:SDR family oxidoreductase n=1 Tax=Alicyclobacillus fastidiosus TaxID=392011 RepID=A0ABV5ABZ2_9BACL|nr:SDR family oxidoreductase [Alicyclobacillus fastidiosus]WEH11499.1 SDR family oxidoreductase [Alicyclobacillus fastidiosus]